MENELANENKVTNHVDRNSQIELDGYSASIDDYTKKIYSERIAIVFHLLNEVS